MNCNVSFKVHGGIGLHVALLVLSAFFGKPHPRFLLAFFFPFCQLNCHVSLRTSDEYTIWEV